MCLLHHECCMAKGFMSRQEHTLFLSSNIISTAAQADALPMQKYFVKVKSFLVKFNLWSNAVATQLEDNRFRVLLDAANDCIIKYTGGFRVSPHCQFLQRRSTYPHFLPLCAY